VILEGKDGAFFPTMKNMSM